MERPIIFSSEMVRAILENRKTQTRRIIKPQPIDILPMKKSNKWVTLETKDPNHGRVIKCRFGIPGDRLWVRETWDVFALPNEVPSICYRADSTAIIILGKVGYQYQRSDNSHKWRPSIHMPRWASRITLEIINVSVERVQDISEEDAKAEGVEKEFEINLEQFINRNTDFSKTSTFKLGFKHLWDSINGKKYPWESNPWVWVIEFRKIN